MEGIASSHPQIAASGSNLSLSSASSTSARNHSAGHRGKQSLPYAVDTDHPGAISGHTEMQGKLLSVDLAASPVSEGGGSFPVSSDDESTFPVADWAASEKQIPSVLVFARYHTWVVAGPLLLTIGATVGGMFAKDSSAADWFPLVQGLLSLVAVLCTFVASLMKTRQLSQLTGDWVYRILTSDPEDLERNKATDLRVLYVQSRAHTAERHRNMGMGVGMVHESDDPLWFFQTEMADWNKSKDGYIVIDKTGVILYVNDALCKNYGYSQREDLLEANIRILMPNPYADQHDFFMKRHMSTGIVNVLGGEREVPILKKGGQQDIVLLHVNDKVDPGDPTNRLFYGRLRFNVTDPAVAAFRQRMTQGESNIPKAAAQLDNHAHAVVIIRNDGCIEFVNKAMVKFFGWTFAEVRGKNVNILMGEPFTSRHDDFLQAYQRRAMEARERGEQPQSKIVGTGRDLMCKAKNGDTLRVFLMVERVDDASGLACRCLFVGRMVAIGRADPGRAQLDQAALARQGSACSGPSDCTSRSSARHSQSTGFTSNNSSRPASSALGGSRVAPSRTARSGDTGATRRTIRKLKLQMSPKMCSVVVIDTHGVYQDGAGRAFLPLNYEAFLDFLTVACQRHKGAKHCIIGDRAVVTFNAEIPNTFHRSSTAEFATQLTTDWPKSKAAPAMRLRIAAVTRQCQVGHASNLQQSLLLGEAVDVCSAILTLGIEARVKHALIDNSLFDELQYSYQCRLVNVMTLHPDTPQARALNIHELQAAKQVDADEWMYQISVDDKADPLATWNAAWEILRDTATASGGAVSKYRSALEPLSGHLAQYPGDKTAEWLQEAVRRRVASGVDVTPPVEIAGKVPFRLRFRLGEVTLPSCRTPSGRRSSSLNKTGLRQPTRLATGTICGPASRAEAYIPKPEPQ